MTRLPSPNLAVLSLNDAAVSPEGRGRVNADALSRVGDANCPDDEAPSLGFAAPKLKIDAQSPEGEALSLGRKPIYPDYLVG